MLTQEDKNKIMELRSQDFSYQAIHDRLGFAIDTIMKVYNEEKEKIVKELGEGKSEKADKSQTKTGAMSFYSSIQEIREISSDIDNVIKHGQLKTEDRMEWNKRKEDLLELLRVEVDDRIAEEIASAVETRDEVWRGFLKQNYVKKEVVTDLDNTIKTKDSIIEDFRNEVVQKDDLLRNSQYEISQLNASHQLEKEDLKNQIRNFYWENHDLREGNWNMHDYIENRFNNDVRREQKQLKHEREVLSDEKISFDKHVKILKSKLDESFFETEKELKDVERREKKLAERELQLKRWDDRFDKNINQICDVYKERINAVEKREKTVTELEKKLLK